MQWKVRCRNCRQEFVLEGAASRVPEHRMAEGPEAPRCAGSGRFGYPMYAGRRAFGRTWWGW